MKDLYKVLQEKEAELATAVKQCEALKIAIALCEDDPSKRDPGADVGKVAVNNVPKRMWP